jgi:hypothetical protein
MHAFFILLLKEIIRKHPGKVSYQLSECTSIIVFAGIVWRVQHPVASSTLHTIYACLISDLAIERSNEHDQDRNDQNST